MIIRKNTNKNQQNKMRANVMKTKHDIFDQIIKLTKQNQYLRTKVDCLQEELDRMNNTKQKYRLKYKNLKQQMQSEEKSVKEKKNSEKQILFNKNRHNQSQGKFYFNSRTDETKKKILLQKQSIELPGTVNYLSSFKDILPEHKVNSENNQKNQEQKDPYNILLGSNKNISQKFHHINSGIDIIANLLNDFLNKVQPMMPNYIGITQEINNKFRIFEEYLLKFLNDIEHYRQRQKNDKINPNLNEINHPSINQILVKSYEAKSERSLRKQFDSSDNRRNRKKQDSQLIQNVDKISSHHSVKNQYNETKKSIKSSQKSSRMKLSKQDKIKRHFNEEYGNKKSIEFNGSQNQNKLFGRFVQSKSQRSFSNDHLHLPFTFQNHQRERIISEHQRIASHEQRNMQESSTRQDQWKMLKEIGKQLKNWKFSMNQLQYNSYPVSSRLSDSIDSHRQRK